MACEFLAHVHLNHLPYFWNAANAGTCPVLELLKAQKFQDVLDMVKEGKVSCAEPLHTSTDSLLDLAMPIFHHNDKGDPLADVKIILEVMNQRQEALRESHLYTACQAGPAFVKLLLAAGAPVGPAALHLAVRRPRQCTVETVQLLVDARASMNALERGCSPLAAACGGIGVPVALLRRLLELGADVAGSKGEVPLHSYARWGKKEGLELLVEHAADVNQQDQLGRTALHCALMGHLKLDFAMALKSSGADVFLKDHEGVTAADLLRKKDKPKEAAAMEGREMNAEELRLLRAMEHPVGRRFSEIYRSVRWVLNRAVPDGSQGSEGSEDEEEEMGEAAPKCSTKISELLGLKPKAVVLQLPLTRYSELWGDLHLTAPEEGFMVKDLLEEIYQFYQSPFTEEELLRIRRHFSKGILGDTFGYIEENVGGEEARKKQRVPRLELRGDSIFFEGFGSCKYFEDDETLWGSMSLGS